MKQYGGCSYEKSINEKSTEFLRNLRKRFHFSTRTTINTTHNGFYLLLNKFPNVINSRRRIHDRINENHKLNIMQCKIKKQRRLGK